MARRPLSIVLIVAGVWTAVGCGRATTDGRPTVVATTTQIADMTRNVVGDHMRVVQLLRPNADAHDYEPRPSDVRAVARAVLLIGNGLGLDGWTATLRESSGTSARVVVASRGAALLPAADGAGTDPHVWMDPANARVMVRNIAQGAAEADPTHAADYLRRAADYSARIAAMDVELTRKVRSVPADRRTIVTDHDAFGYLTHHYGIRSVGAVMPSQSGAGEPSAQAIARLAATVRREGVRTVFAQASLDPALSRALAEEAGVEVSAALYGDSLGPAGSPGDTYLAMMRHDVTTIVAGMSTT